MNDFLYNELNKAWKTTCKVLFKEEIGELKEYEEWLNDYKEEQIRIKRDDEDIIIDRRYSEAKNILDYKKIKFTKRFEPLDINEIKDIDSIVEALKERFVYAGNVILGRSENIEKSNEIIDSFNIYYSSNIFKSRYVSHSSYLRNCEYTFGSRLGGNASFTIRTSQFGGKGSTRIFESFIIVDSSDIYYSHLCSGVTEGMFSFFQYGKSYIIGNLKLNKDKYDKIKSKLIEDIKINLENKKFINLEDLYFGDRKDLPDINESEEPLFNKEIIEKSFKTTTKIVIGKEIEDVDKYQKWLSNLPLYELIKVNTTFGNATYISSKISKFKFPLNSMVNNHEIKSISKISLTEKEVEELNLTNINKLRRILSRIYFITQEIIEGRSINNFPLITVFSSLDNYKSSIMVYSEKTAFSVWPRNSKYIFGSENIYESQFCIKSYNSSDIQRAFEVDNCQNSSDIYFSHNVENVIEGMFNFNVKNMSYAIGNAKYERDKYMKIKSSLLEQIANELEAKKDLKWSIYNIGAKSK